MTGQRMEAPIPAQPPPLSMDVPRLWGTGRTPEVTPPPAIHPGMTDDDIRLVLSAMPYFEHARFVQSNGIAGFNIPEVAWFRHCEFGTSVDRYSYHYPDDRTRQSRCGASMMERFDRFSDSWASNLVAGLAGIGLGLGAIAVDTSRPFAFWSLLLVAAIFVSFSVDVGKFIR